MTNWTITGRIWAVLSLSVLVGSAAGGFLFLRLENQASDYERLFKHDVSTQDLARIAQVTFKKQVQEWKDVLLRGKDPASLRKYSSAFEKESENVRELTARLKQTVDGPGTGEIVNRFVEAHAAMSVSYGRALEVFTASHATEQAQADAMVKGQDRIPTDLMGLLASAYLHKSAYFSLGPVG
jgi:methyl-accepting chemotaxis protein-1 (serine sensor receptor)